MLLQLGKIDEAEAAYRDVLAKQPQDFQSLLGLAGIQLGRKKYDEAGKLYEQAKKISPLDPRPRLGAAAVKARSGQVAEALKELEEVDPRARSGNVVMALASYYLQANRPADAQRILEPIVGRFPKVPQPRYLLGAAYMANGRFDLAVPQFEELARLAPNDPRVRLPLAASYSRTGKPKEALAGLDRIAKDADKSPGYHEERGLALMLLAKTDEALKEAQIAQGLAPESGAPLLLMGQIYARRGDTKAAREMFARASAVSTTDASPHLALGRLAQLDQNQDAALKEFDAAVQADPKSLRAVGAKASLLVQQKKTKEAIQFVEGVAAKEPKNSELQTLLGALYVRDQQVERSAAAYRKAVDLDPKAVAPRLGLAQAIRWRFSCCSASTTVSRATIRRSRCSSPGSRPTRARLPSRLRWPRCT